MRDVTPLAAIEPLLQLSEEACAALRARLREVGYGPALLLEAEAVAPGQLDAIRLPLVQRRLERRGDTGARVALLFEYRASLSRAESEAALGPRLLAALERAGLVRERAGSFEATCRITPLEGLYFISDPHRAAPDAAMGPGLTTLDLLRALPERPGPVLDVGCGAGTLALVAAARGSPRALGVDLNERAVALARLNARLNGVPAEFRAGDLLEPVQGEWFELVLSQPPYVVQPPGVERVTYLHGGPRGDELALRFASALPQALGPRGRALLLFDSAVTATPLVARVREALGSAGIDLVVLLAKGPSPDLQAVGYASIEDPSLGARYGEALRRYRDHLEAAGATAFSRALVVLERAGGPALDAQLPVEGFAGLDARRLDALVHGLRLAGADRDTLLSAAVRLAPGGRLVEEREAGALSLEPRRAVRFDTAGVATGREISEAGAFLFAALDSSASVAEAARRFAEACRESDLSDKVLDFVREGLSRALLVPAISSPRSSTL